MRPTTILTRLGALVPKLPTVAPGKGQGYPKLLSDLASRSPFPFTRLAAEFNLQLAWQAAAKARTIAFETVREIKLATGKKVKRRYDHIIDDVLHVEAKQWVGWTKFPPDHASRSS